MGTPVTLTCHQSAEYCCTVMPTCVQGVPAAHITTWSLSLHVVVRRYEQYLQQAWLPSNQQASARSLFLAIHHVAVAVQLGGQGREERKQGRGGVGREGGGGAEGEVVEGGEEEREEG